MVDRCLETCANFCSNVVYKRAVLTSEPSTPPTLITFKTAQVNNVIIYYMAKPDVISKSIQD